MNVNGKDDLGVGEPRKEVTSTMLHGSAYKSHTVSLDIALDAQSDWQTEASHLSDLHWGLGPSGD